MVPEAACAGGKEWARNMDKPVPTHRSSHMLTIKASNLQYWRWHPDTHGLRVTPSGTDSLTLTLHQSHLQTYSSMQTAHVDRTLFQHAQTRNANTQHNMALLQGSLGNFDVKPISLFLREVMQALQCECLKGIPLGP